MQLVEINHLDEIKKHILALTRFCKRAELDSSPTSENMAFTNWQINNASLLYLLKIEQRLTWPKGCFYIVYEKNDIVACSGLYISEFSPDIIIGGVRAYTLSEFRTKYIHGNIIFPKQIQTAKEKGAKLFLLSFNSYNDKLYKFIVRGSQGKGTAFGLGFSDTYKNFQLHDKQIIIKNVPQTILKLPLEENYEYDFSNIECN